MAPTKSLIGKRMSIGIDQSYVRTGISVAIDGKLVKVSSIKFKGCKNKSEKRRQLRNTLEKIIECNQQKVDSMVFLCERIRTFTGSNKLRPSYLKATGALIATIVDVGYEHGIETYSADTRSWKARIVGTSKNKDPENKKAETIQHIIKLGFRSSIESVNKKGEIVYDDDAADSGCIALYEFLPPRCKSLLLEE